MNLLLTRLRDRSSDFATFGQLEVAGVTFCTVEQPWNNNTIAHSCVPAGVYQLFPHLSPSKGNVFILNGPAYNVYSSYPTPPGGRSEILIHVANFAQELQGCIAPGIAFGKLVWGGQMTDAVLSSKVAFDHLMSILDHQTHTLTIKWDDEVVQPTTHIPAVVPPAATSSPNGTGLLSIIFAFLKLIASIFKR